MMRPWRKFWKEELYENIETIEIYLWDLSSYY